MMGTESMPKYWLPWLVGMPAEQSRAACCLIFGGVLERLPKLRVCLAHGGGSFPYTIGRIEHGFNMRPDLVATDNPRNPREYLKRLYFDSWVADDPRALRYLLDTVGIDRVMLGTDYPFPLGEQTGRRHRTRWPWTRHNARLYHGTALEWLGLPAGFEARMTEIFSDAYAASRPRCRRPARATSAANSTAARHDGKRRPTSAAIRWACSRRARARMSSRSARQMGDARRRRPFRGQAPWMPYHELVRDPLARVVGAQPREVVAMNSLTANLHLMMVSFYRPTARTPAIC
jgi:hypothetical protein